MGKVLSDFVHPGANVEGELRSKAYNGHVAMAPVYKKPPTNKDDTSETASLRCSFHFSRATSTGH